ncbi:MAG: hypothetical protein HZB16_07375 [Armatimonadetes bacterium]|nr:hypothetical protein [Armatimonadota bacterium]
MRRCLICCCLWVVAASGLWAAQPRALAVFDEAPAEGVPGSRLTVGYGGARFGRMTPAEAATVAHITAAGTLPVSDEAPYAGRVCLRINLASAAWGDWEAELPLPSLAPLGDARDLVLVLAVRGDAAAEGLEVGLRDGAVPRHAIRLPLARYGPVANAWTLYRIRLTEFSALMPALDMDHLASLVFGSSRPSAGTVDVDQVLIQTADGDAGPAWVVTPTVTRPTRPVPAPVIPPVTPPMLPVIPPAAPLAPARLTGGAESTSPSSSDPTDPPAMRTTDLPPVPVAPEASEPRLVQRPIPTTPTAPPTPPTPPIRVVQATDGGGAKPPAPTDPPAGVTPPTPTTPTLPVPLGPRPVAPATGGTPRLDPGDTRPMSVVSVYFGGGPLGPCAESRLRAVWATNRGEREFEPAEMRTAFDVADDGRLPITADDAQPAGVLKLEVKEAGFAWWLARLELAAGRLSNEGNWLKNGRLEIVVRGGSGGEVFRVGLVDGQDQPEMALLALNRLAAVTTEWQTIRVPLRSLKAENPRLDWTKVRAAVLASANGRPLTAYIAEVRIVNPAQN